MGDYVVPTVLIFSDVTLTIQTTLFGQDKVDAHYNT